MSIIKETFMQECACCGKRFPATYVFDTERKTFGFEYSDAQPPCECEDDFIPIGDSPSIGEWLPTISERRD